MSPERPRLTENIVREIEDCCYLCFAYVKHGWINLTSFHFTIHFLPFDWKTACVFVCFVVLLKFVLSTHKKKTAYIPPIACYISFFIWHLVLVLADRSHCSSFSFHQNTEEKKTETFMTIGNVCFVGFFFFFVYILNIIINIVNSIYICLLSAVLGFKLRSSLFSGCVFCACSLHLLTFSIPFRWHGL